MCGIIGSTRVLWSASHCLLTLRIFITCSSVRSSSLSWQTAAICGGLSTHFTCAGLGLSSPDGFFILLVAPAQRSGCAVADEQIGILPAHHDFPFALNLQLLPSMPGRLRLPARFFRRTRPRSWVDLCGAGDFWTFQASAIRIAYTRPGPSHQVFLVDRDFLRRFPLLRTFLFHTAIATLTSKAFIAFKTIGTAGHFFILAWVVLRDANVSKEHFHMRSLAHRTIEIPKYVDFAIGLESGIAAQDKCTWAAYRSNSVKTS